MFSARTVATLSILALLSVGCPTGDASTETGEPDTGGGTDTAEEATDAEDVADDTESEQADTTDTERRDGGDTRTTDDTRTPSDGDGETGDGETGDDIDAGCVPTNQGVEICDGDDNDCDGRTDEICPAGTTLVGDDNTDRINAVASAPSGVYFGGTTSGPLDGETISGNFDGFVGRLAADGSIDWLRIFGSDGSERIDAIAVGPGGGIFAVGSGDAAFGGGSFNGQSDAMVVKFDASGARQWVEFVGSDAIEFGRAVDLLSDGRLVVAYQTRDPFGGGPTEGVAAILSPRGASQTTVTLGEDARAVDVGPNGDVAIGGEVSGGFDHDQTSGRGAGDGFVAVVDPDGERRWSRLVGGSARDTVHDVAFDGQSIYATGATESSVAGETPDGRDGFVGRFDGADDRAWFTLFGGAGEDAGRGIAIVENAEVFALGTVADTFAGESVSGESDVALLSLTADGTRSGGRLYGSSAAESARSISAGPTAPAVGGRTEGAFEGETHRGGVDGFVTRLR